MALWLSLLSTCSWCVVSTSTWLALWLSLLSTCSWCVVSALTPFPVKAVASSKWMLHTGGGYTPHMIVKRFGCTAIHNKALYKCIIHLFRITWYINCCIHFDYTWTIHILINKTLRHWFLYLSFMDTAISKKCHKKNINKSQEWVWILREYKQNTF